MPRTLTLVDMQEIAATRGGKCLSQEYVNSQTHLQWVCAKGHKWAAAPSEIRRGKWCGKCSRRGQSGKYTLEEVQGIAASRGGKCLSSEYKNQKTKIKWQCAHGHIWLSRLNGVINQGQWCPQCSTGLGERIARAYFEQIFGKPFPNSRPQWLKGENKGNLELDGYCEALGLAFEHQGMHHYQPERYGQNKQKDSEEWHKVTLMHDALKRELCIQRGITLFEIPEIPRLLKLGDIFSFIISECRKKGVKLPENAASIQVDLKPAYSANAQAEALKKFQELAKAKGGNCLAESYTNLSTRIEWECKEGHRWYASPRSIEHRNSWCPECAGLKPLTLKDAHEAASDRGGKCLSSKCTSGKQKLLWECAKGHRWQAALSHIKAKNSWCPECAGVKKLTIEHAHEIAGQRGGKCLSEEYKNNRTKLKWQCSKGHIWRATLADVKNSGSWCHECAGVKKLTLDVFQRIADERGGKCLSSEYNNLKARLKFRCSRGHEWETLASVVWKQKSWCPVCAQRVPLGIEQMQEIAKKRGGECLSATYVNALTPLKWRCDKGHEWMARPSNVKNLNQWCPECGKKKAVENRKAKRKKHQNMAEGSGQSEFVF